MLSTLTSLFVVMTVINLHTYGVQCRARPSVEEMASNYIVSRLFPSHSQLASDLLNVLVKSVEDKYQLQQERENQQGDEEEEVSVDDEEEERQNYDEEEDNDDRISDNTVHERRNILASPADDDDDVISDDGVIAGSVMNSFEEIVRRSSMRHQQQPQQQQQQRKQPTRRFVLGQSRRLRRLPARKRGLGHCIHKCINGSGHMNFIQCKSMCH